MEKRLIKLELGSGRPSFEDYVTLDNDPSTGADITIDFFDVSPRTLVELVAAYIDPDEYTGEGKRLIDQGGFNEIRAHHFLEHLPGDRKVEAMRQCFDLLAPGGTLDIEAPLFPHPASVQDPTHISFWCEASFWYFTKGNKFGEAFAKRHSTPKPPLFELVEETWRVEGEPQYLKRNQIRMHSPSERWAYRIIFKKPQ